ncbi:hypothetical protein [Mycoplasmopsis pullorum]|uniref:Uncharacterized protein n=1 Tax=Mycoplasmopsis pullorum TaxID=48003 RepID=A0A1L4FSU9_9BACT|nr:hypothetical protein [Mycoplasmopsis pullorum]APJ38676.1 hypothetical protein BLA55_03380 [Mycoplasmopsis pullorum]
MQKEFYESKQRIQNKIYFHCKREKEIISFNQKYVFTIYCYSQKINGKNKVFKYIPIPNLAWISAEKYDRAFVYETLCSTFLANANLSSLNLICNVPSRSFLYMSKKKLIAQYEKFSQTQNSLKSKAGIQHKVNIDIHLDDFYKTVVINKNNQLVAFRLVYFKFLNCHSNEIIKTKIHIYRLNQFKTHHEFVTELQKQISHYASNINQINVLSDNARVFKKIAHSLGAKHILDSFHFTKAFFDLLLFRKNETHYKSNRHWISKIEQKHNFKLTQTFQKLLKNRDIQQIIKYLKNFIVQYQSLIPSSKIRQIQSFINNYKNNISCYINNYTCEAESIVSKIKYQVFKPKTVYSIESLFFKIKILCP